MAAAASLTSTTTNLSSDHVIDTTSLLSNSVGSHVETSPDGRSGRRQSLRDTAQFLSRVSSRRLMREPSMLVRETAAEQLEERQNDWAYSKPVVVLDIIWNFSFVVVAGMVLFLSRNESPTMPLRLWIVGYALQCVLRMVCVTIEFRKRRRHFPSNYSSAQDGTRGIGILSSELRESSSQYVSLSHLEEDGICVAKHLESVNTMFSFIWWIIGFYWVSAGGQSLANVSPQLYWLCIIFLGFDVFLVVFCVALAFVIGVAVCCCLPCIIAILYAVADQDGAAKEDIEKLSKFKFQRITNGEKNGCDTHGAAGGKMTECGTDSPTEHVLLPEDAECCICLSAYDDGVELRELPCTHHFHCTCVDKWLYINATCPLCKYNILKSTGHDMGEV